MVKFQTKKSTEDIARGRITNGTMGRLTGTTQEMGDIRAKLGYEGRSSSPRLRYTTDNSQPAINKK